jgi:hypothetical protein
MEALEKKRVSVTKLCQYLLSLPSFVNCEDPTLLSQDADEFEDAGSIPKIFKILTTKKYIDFLNYDILNNLVTNFNLKLDRKSSKYPRELRKYAEKLRINEFSEVFPWLKKVEVKKKKITLIVDIPATSKFSAVLDIREEFASILGICVSALDIVNVKEHCIHLEFILPTFIADRIFTKDTTFSAEQTDSLKRLSVLSLECNGFMQFFHGHTGGTTDTSVFEMESLGHALAFEPKRTHMEDLTMQRSAANATESTLQMPGLWYCLLLLLE